ncbi:MAG: helix-turn-helix domain-containing protein [Paracoccaceae bacterium]
MAQSTKYPAREGLQFLVDTFGLNPTRVLRKAGLPSDFLTLGGRLVTATEYTDVWEALPTELPDPDLPLKLAQIVDAQGFDSSAYAFFASPTVRIGLERKALIKPLVMPLQMRVTDYDAHVALSFSSIMPTRPLPVVVGWFLLIYFVLAIRRATGVAVHPVALQAEQPYQDWQGADAFFRCPVAQGPGYRLIFAAQDTELPLMSRDDAAWGSVTAGLHDRFHLNVHPTGMAARVRLALVENLPGGLSSADQIASTLAMSKRSLQRKLKDEGFSFKDVLEDTRRALALNHLHNTDMSVQEIAYILGFRDPSSFFRAFRNWTGTTPLAVRKQGVQV